jgi:hypothetical protein
MATLLRNRPDLSALMRWDPSTYDDDRELTEYIWHNYPNFLTAFEHNVRMAHIADWKADHSENPKYAAVIRERFGMRDDPRVVEALQRDFTTFAREARDRILAEHSSEVFINRCARCQRIVATPKARQCLWCGYKWHDRR